MLWRVFLLVLVVFAVCGRAASDVVAHPTDPSHEFIWDGHWTATWDWNGVWRITEKADFTVTVAFGGPEATRYSSGTAIMRVTEIHDLPPVAPCRTLASLPSSPITVGIRAAVRWTLPSHQSNPRICDVVNQYLEEARRFRDAYTDPRLLDQAQREHWDSDKFRQRVIEDVLGPWATEGSGLIVPMHTERRTCEVVDDHPEFYRDLPQVLHDADWAHEMVHHSHCVDETPRVFDHEMKSPEFIGPEEGRAYSENIRILQDWLHQNCQLPRFPPASPGEMQFSIGEFMPILVPTEEHCADSVTPGALFSVGTHGALCRTLYTATRGCRGFGYFNRPYTIPIRGLIAKYEEDVQTHDQGASGDIVNTAHLEMEASGRCPAPGREAWVLQRAGSDHSATVNDSPAPDRGAAVPVPGTLLATDRAGILAVQFADLSEVWLHPSSQVRIIRASCDLNTGMQILLGAERGSIEIVYGGHLGGGIGYLPSATTSPPTVITTYHPERVRSFP